MPYVLCELYELCPGPRCGVFMYYVYPVHSISCVYICIYMDISCVYPVWYRCYMCVVAVTCTYDIVLWLLCIMCVFICSICGI